ncbi:hypothetical protein CSKR_200729 [Clonorchis sinensis]|uniref:Uncharacterized protein n=1 Tax=Clonorchis sinensis TaxID=79923 RepID=A0A8T1MH47_CLOSI|nr:hypothetical protein CSKR_200729 [Clonorchis sinensis]
MVILIEAELRDISCRILIYALPFIVFMCEHETVVCTCENSEQDPVTISSYQNALKQNSNCILVHNSHIHHDQRIVIDRSGGRAQLCSKQSQFTLQVTN